MKKDIESEIKILNKMITSLVDLLEEKGIVTNEEWEKKIRKEIKGGVEYEK